MLFRSTLLSRSNKVGLRCPSVLMYVRTYVRPSSKSSVDFIEIWHVGRGRWVMHNVCSMTWSKVKVMSNFQTLSPPFTMGAGNWPLILKFDRAVFLIFDTVFVSCDFERGRNVSRKDSTISVPHGANLSSGEMSAASVFKSFLGVIWETQLKLWYYF